MIYGHSGLHSGDMIASVGGPSCRLPSNGTDGQGVADVHGGLQLAGPGSLVRFPEVTTNVLPFPTAFQLQVCQIEDMLLSVSVAIRRHTDHLPIEL